MSSAEYIRQEMEGEGPELDRSDYLWFISDIDRRGDISLALESIPYITGRLGREMAASQNLTGEEWRECFNVGKATRLVLWNLSHITLEKNNVRYHENALHGLGQSVDVLYGYLQSDIPALRYFAQQMVPDMLVVDAQLSRVDRGLGLHDRYRQDLIQYLVSPQNEKDTDNAVGLLDAAFARGGAESYLIPVLKAVSDKEGAQRVFSLFSNRISPATCLRIMRDSAAHDDEFRSKVRQIYTWLELMPSSGEVTDVKELYEHKFDISQWKPNDETLRFDIDFIQKHTADAHELLDIACGAGRHMLELNSEGRSVTGVDVALTNVKHIKDRDPQARAVVASWHHLPFRHEQFDAAYCLGRSFQHNSTVEDVEMALREAWSVLKPGGTLLIDSASTQMGYVGQKKEEFDQKMKQLGIHHSQSGLMVSSPNGVDFVERFVPAPDTFKHLALLAGFNVERVEEQRYTDHHGKENVNYYYALRKADPPVEDRLEAERQTAFRAPLFIQWI